MRTRRGSKNFQALIITSSIPCTSCTGYKNGKSHDRRRKNRTAHTLKLDKKIESKDKSVIKQTLCQNDEGQSLKIDTKDHCLICYKRCENDLLKFASSHTVDESIGIQNDENETDFGSHLYKAEVCSLYVKLISRYLNLNLFSKEQDFHSSTSLEFMACNACLIILKKFCKRYSDFETAKMQLDWSVSKIRDVMKCADKVPSRLSEFNNKVVGGMKIREKQAMDGFRRNFFRKSKQNTFPKITLSRCGTENSNNKHVSSHIQEQRKILVAPSKCHMAKTDAENVNDINMSANNEISEQNRSAENAETTGQATTSITNDVELHVREELRLISNTNERSRCPSSSQQQEPMHRNDITSDKSPNNLSLEISKGRKRKPSSQRRKSKRRRTTSAGQKVYQSYESTQPASEPELIDLCADDEEDCSMNARSSIDSITITGASTNIEDLGYGSVNNAEDTSQTANLAETVSPRPKITSKLTEQPQGIVSPEIAFPGASPVASSPEVSPGTHATDLLVPLCEIENPSSFTMVESLVQATEDSSSRTAGSSSLTSEHFSGSSSTLSSPVFLSSQQRDESLNDLHYDISQNLDYPPTNSQFGLNRHPSGEPAYDNDHSYLGEYSQTHEAQHFIPTEHQQSNGEYIDQLSFQFPAPMNHGCSLDEPGVYNVPYVNPEVIYSVNGYSGDTHEPPSYSENNQLPFNSQQYPMPGTSAPTYVHMQPPPHLDSNFQSSRFIPENFMFFPSYNSHTINISPNPSAYVIHSSEYGPIITEYEDEDFTRVDIHNGISNNEPGVIISEVLDEDNPEGKTDGGEKSSGENISVTVHSNIANVAAFNKMQDHICNEIDNTQNREVCI